MATPKSTHWSLPPHTRAKHQILRYYLDAWLPMLSSYSGKILYVDGFAGPGREAENGADGSPIIALKAVLEHPFFKSAKNQNEILFLFIEGKKSRAEALEREIEALNKKTPMPKWLKYEVKHGQFASVMTGILDALESVQYKLAPTFAFIDPFGFGGTPMEVIARIAKNPRCECLITFMFESINRFISHPDEKIQKNFDELFGTIKWREIVKLPFDENRRDAILQLYHNQLMESAKFKYVRTFEMIDRGNHTEYFLYFGTNHPLGLSKMKEAMWKVDPVAGEKFSDRTNRSQMVLFEQEPNLVRLRLLLQERFRGKGWIPIEDISNFVLLDTAYSENKHLKMKTLKPMESSSPPLISVNRLSGKVNRKWAYPEGTLIEFI